MVCWGTVTTTGISEKGDLMEKLRKEEEKERSSGREKEQKEKKTQKEKRKKKEKEKKKENIWQREKEFGHSDDLHGESVHNLCQRLI